MSAIQQAVKQSVSQSGQRLSLVAARQWTGLCVASCLALNWPLSMENLGAVKASLLSTYVRRSRSGSSGAPSERPKDEWSTFAQKVLADLRRDSKRTLMGTRWSWLNFLQSSLTRRIYSTRRTLLRSHKQLLTGGK